MKKSNLPEFPNFVSLHPNHQAEFANMAELTQPYSDYNFISLWSWDHQNTLKICQLNDNLVIRAQDYQDPSDYFYSFFGTNKVDETAITLLKHSEEESKTELRLIPEAVISSLANPELFVIKEDRDNFDYIVAIADMVELKNNPKKKWSMNQFMTRHSKNLAVKELDIKDASNTEAMLSVVKNWQQQMISRDSYSDNEVAALGRMLSQHHHIKTDNLHIIGIYLGDELKAFSISEILGNGFAMGHYKKSDRSYRGLGVALEHHTAKSLQAKGVSHINHEQDLGLEGLRQSKMSHRPVYFLKKYTLGLKD